MNFHRKGARKVANGIEGSVGLPYKLRNSLPHNISPLCVVRYSLCSKSKETNQNVPLSLDAACQ